MAPRPTFLLALVLCLGQAILTQEGHLPRASISAELGPVTPWGRNVTVLCRADGDFEMFRLENCSTGSCSTVREERNTLPLKTEAKFLLTLMNAGRYACICKNLSTWCSRSEILEFVVTGAGVTQAPNTAASALPSDSTSPRATQTPADDSHIATRGLKAEHLYILTGVSMGFLLLLLLLLLSCFHRQRQSKHGPPRHKDQEQRPQERASLAGDSPGRTADQATADQRLQQGREQGTSTLQQSPHEVTYAQLDHRALTQSGAQDVSPRSTAESSTYAILARH